MSRGLGPGAVLRLNDGDFHCEAVARDLPGKRLVLRGRYPGGEGYLKLYLDPRRGARHARRELRGLRLFHAAGIAAPRLIGTGRLIDLGLPYVLLAALSPALGYTDLAPARRDAAMHELAALLAVQHAAGVMQRDIHLDNFVWSQGRIHTLDGGGAAPLGGLRSHGRAMANLALLLAQFPLQPQAAYLAALEVYRATRPVSYPAARFLRLVRQQRARRLRRWRAKLLRNCSRIAVARLPGQTLYYNRGTYDPALAALLADPDASLANAVRLLKDGNSSTVWQLSSAIGDLVVKRYNSKSPWHALTRLLRRSRALTSWENAHALESLGIATPTPIAALVRRSPWWRTTAYFISRHVAGESSGAWFARTPADPAQWQATAQATLDLLHSLAAAQASHGDLKASNILLVEGRPTLIDLDAMRFHRFALGWRRAWARDMRRFLHNWAGRPHLAAWFAAALARWRPGA